MAEAGLILPLPKHAHACLGGTVAIGKGDSVDDIRTKASVEATHVHLWHLR